jgi:nucleotide-binding universal stress UspA family protein
MKVGYKTLLAHLEIGETNTGLLHTTLALARLLNAGVIGVGACQPTQIIINDGYVSGDVIEQERAELDAALEAAEAEFRAAFAGFPHAIEWRAAVTLAPLHFFLTDEARRADLVVTGVAKRGFFEGWTRHASNGDLAMLAGRPMLIVPEHGADFALKQVLVAWKDVREARRAVADAIPLLRHAGHVTIVEIARDTEDATRHVNDVAKYLAAHGIKAEALALAADGDDAAQLNRIAGERQADLVVAGAYGHNRLREWALGGVTRDMLMRPSRTTLISH